MKHFSFNYPTDDTRYNDAYVTWLIHCDGPQNSTYQIDYSRKKNGPLVMNSTYMGGSGGGLTTNAMYFNGSANAYSPVNLNNSFNLSDNDWTIDWWEWRQDGTPGRPSFTWDTLGVTYVPMLVGWSDPMYFYASNDQASWNMASAVPMGAIQVQLWTHRAVVRKGGTFYTFQNGVLQATAAVGGNGIFNICTYGPLLGCWANPGGAVYTFGYMDEFRVSNGIARWTANFTPPGVYAPDPDLNTVLLAHMDNTTIDASQYKRGVATGGPGIAWNTTQKKFGEASLLYNGVDGYIQYPDHSDWAIGDNHTIDLWIRPTALPPAGQAGCITSHLVGDTGWIFMLLSDGNVTFLQRQPDGDYSSYANVVMVVPNNWYHVAFVRSNRVNTVYVNGIGGPPITSPVLPAGSSALFFGMWGAGTSYPFSGYMDELRITKGKALWTANFTPPAEPAPINPDKTVLLLHFDGNFKDSSQERQVVQQSTAVIDIQQKKFGTAAALFGGSNLCYVPTTPASLNFGVNDFTIDCWIRDSGALGTNRGLFGRCSPGLVDLTCGALLGTDNRMQCWFGKTGTDWVVQGVVGIHDVTQNAWHHWAVTRQNGVFRSYLDGILDAGPNDYGNFPIYVSTWSFVIGAIGNNANYWTGYVDEFRITMGRALWTANFTPPIQPGS